MRENNISENFINDLELLKGEKIDLIDIENIPCKEISDEICLISKPLVSVVIITYNHESYLNKTIESIIKQKVTFPFEIIIAEDCSTDKTREIIMDCQSRNPDKIRFLFSDNNVGITKNAIRADLKTRGKYIAYCEGDDYWIDNFKLEKQVEIMQSDSEIGLVFSRAKEFIYDKDIYVDTQALKSLSFGLNKKNEYFSKRLISSIPITTCTVMVKQEVIISNIYNNILFKINSKMMDMPRWFASTYNMKTYYMADFTGAYVIHLDSVSNNWNLNETARQGSVVLFTFLSLYGSESNLVNKSKVFYRMISHAFYLKDNNFKIACETLAKKHDIKLSVLANVKIYAMNKPFIYCIVSNLLNLRRKLSER